ncbi:hypothetical protein [uncultured Ferrovibrio sp.]|jgi:hypothetical protein|uniref:hypothetical protein n=1 Tax=uncultured Ferrovibrio sp. TaxID=1576913 RepID=UPI00260C3BBB|nr:hypothetical protein [uncultured Ferrovibrio sp.]
MKQGLSLGRRDLLRGLIMTGGTTATVFAATAVRDAHAYDPGQRERVARYQPDSADVQAFYRTNGYETLKK